MSVTKLPIKIWRRSLALLEIKAKMTGMTGIYFFTPRRPRPISFASLH